jgi:hypothetical protein
MGLQNSRGADLADGAYDDALAVSPSDTISPANRLSGVRGLVADVGGNLTLITATVAAAGDNGGSAVTAAQAVEFVVPTGVILPIRAAYVLATGTAATGIKALF